MVYKLTRKAANDIANIYVQGVEIFGIPQAEKYHADMKLKFELISDTPYLTRERNEFDPPVYIHPYESHIIIYTVDDDSDITILRVRHGNEDWKHNPVGD
jgi:toxin ParE1/3/4